MKHLFFVVLTASLIASCASKKEIIYMQDADSFENSKVNFDSPVLQPNDIIRINVTALIPEAAIPYNRITEGQGMVSNIDVMQLDGYLVNEDSSINFPVLGKISVAGMTTKDLEKNIASRLDSEGHLKKPTVNVRLLNAKITILGEVNQPGTYRFTEQNISLLQAIGFAGDLTINGKREDVRLIRQIGDVRTVTTLDLTASSFLESDYYFLKPNDVLVINPNNPKVKTAGFIGSSGTVLTIASLVLSTVILLTR